MNHVELLQVPLLTFLPDEVHFQSANVTCYDAWIKSTAIRFYEIDYAWRKGGKHPKRGKFSLVFFIKVGNLILVLEIKGDEELREPSEENRKKGI